jgi:imidazolonepropionase-like amidohydrolase
MNAMIPIRSVAIFSMACLALLATAGSSGAQEAEPTVILTNGNVIDATGGPLLENATIVIRGNRIAEIRSGRYEPGADAGVRVFDLEGGYVLPGLWNNHSHLGDLLPDPNNILPGEPVLPAAIRSGRNAMDALQRGFTSLRMAGERDYIDVAWRDAFAARVFVGPRIVASGNPIAATGGHGTENIGPVAMEIDGPYEMREEGREDIKHGADIIKIMLDELTADEIEAAIETAHASGLKVIGHAAEPGAGLAVKLGIDGIEHGYGLTDETIAMMAAKGTFYDPTIVCNLSAEYIEEREAKIAELGLDEDPLAIAGRIEVAYADERSPRGALRQREILQKAFAAGVKIIPGSDSNPIGEISLLEIEQFVWSGLSEMDAIVAATRNSAEMVGMLDDVGTIEVGKIADLIVVEANPLDHISNLRRLRMVFKDGVPVSLVRDEGQKSFWELYMR